jgi:hypothetical protein
VAPGANLEPDLRKSTTSLRWTVGSLVIGTPLGDIVRRCRWLLADGTRESPVAGRR